MPHAAVFDFDMTLADSSAGVIACVNYALVRLHRPAADEAAIRRTIGLPLARTFTMLTASHDPHETAAFSHLFVEHADRHMAELTMMFPGVPSLLIWLRSHGVATAIVSTKFRYRIKEILCRHGLTGLVDAIVGGEDVAEHKPSPAGILAVLATLRVPASNACYVGDHPVDEEAAYRAGVPFIPVLSGSSAPHDFRRVAPSNFLRAITEVMPLLQRRWTILQ